MHGAVRLALRLGRLSALLKFRDWSLRKQLALLVLGALLPAIGAIAYGIAYSAKQSLDSATGKVEMLAAQTADRLGERLHADEVVLAKLAERPLIKALDPARCDVAARELVAMRPDYANVAVHDLKGDVVCSTLGLLPAGAVREDPWFVQGIASGGFHAGGVFRGRLTGRWLAMLTYPLRERGGRLTGLVTLPLDLAKLQQTLFGAVPEEAVVSVVDGERRILMRSSGGEDWIGRSAVTPQVAATLRLDGAGVMRVPGVDGVKRIYAFHPVPGTSWTVVAGIPEEVIFAGYRQRLQNGIALGIAALLLAAMLAWRIGKSIVAPVRGLQQVVTALAEGDTAARAEEAGSRELATVARQFNRMLERRLAVEQSLRESEERNRTLLAASPDGIWMHRMGTIEYVNEALLRILGYSSASEMVGREIAEFFVPQHRDALRRRLKEISTSFEPTPLIDTVMLRRDGSRIEVETTASPFREGNTVRVIAMFRDITQRKRSELARDQLAAIVESSNDAIISRTLEGTILTWNAAAERLFGYRAAEAIGRPIAMIIPGEVQSIVDAHSQVLREGGHLPPEEVVRQRKDGSLIDVTHTISAVRNQAGEIISVAVMMRDDTERKRAERALRESEALFREFAENTPDIFWIAEVDTPRLLYVSPAWTRITGHAPHSSREEFMRVVHPEDAERLARDLRTMPHGGLDQELRVLRPDGAVRWLRIQTFPLRDAEGRIYRIAGIGEDITERKEDEQRLRQMAHYDALTDLPNRTLFNQSLRRTLEHAGERGSTTGVLFIDLDRFKVVNDTLGHAAGDELLQQVAARLVECVRVRDVIGRLGGDEFALLLPNLEAASDAGIVAAKIIEALSQPFRLRNQEVFVTASIGITIFPDDATDAATLLRFADAAMYGAKEEGRNSYRFYTAEMNARAMERLDLENALRRALERKEFLLHYQPKFDLKTQRITGLEALLRWQRPDFGLVPPADFIPVLEDTGLIVPVGEWVIGEACRQIRAWEEEGLGALGVAVNLSPRQFYQRNLGGVIAETVRAHGVDPSLLEFELTETSLMLHADKTVRILEELGALGIRFAVDDFGTGYSSLAYLKRFPIDTVKIDRTFVRDIISDPDDAAITLAVITMAHALKLRVVAEGVETSEQLGFLGLNHCDEAQGYYFAEPLAPAALSSLLREQPWKKEGAARRPGNALSAKGAQQGGGDQRAAIRKVSPAAVKGGNGV